jgi:nucleoside-diphosphate-sugar epimerase
MVGRTKVLLTGATGRVGGILREHWGDRYQLRLADVRPLGAATILASGEPETRKMNYTPLQVHEEFIYCDCAVYEQMLDACKGMDVVVHLAADPNPGSDWETSLLPRNVVGCYNAFQAAHEGGCSRIVFASSVNAIVGYAVEDWHGAAGIGVNTPVWPANVYGAAKCFGEVWALSVP